MAYFVTINTVQQTDMCTMETGFALTEKDGETGMNILMSIKPKWCKKIISGEKRIEVRKTAPLHLLTPFQVFVYAAYGGENWHYNGKRMSGLVIGEFTCSTILEYNMNHTGTELLSNGSCVPQKALRKYAGVLPVLKGWHIKDFQLYEEPLPISSFLDSKGNRFKRSPQSWQYAIKMDS